MQISRKTRRFLTDNGVKDFEVDWITLSTDLALLTPNTVLKIMAAHKPDAGPKGSGTLGVRYGFNVGCLADCLLVTVAEYMMSSELLRMTSSICCKHTEALGASS